MRRGTHIKTIKSDKANLAAALTGPTAKKICVLGLSVFFIAAAPIPHFSKQILNKTKKAMRIRQAKELLGHYYKRSVVKTGESVSNIPDFVQEEVKNSLKEEYKSEAKKLARTIVKQSQKYQLDPIFVMSIIDHESMFNPSIRGSHGEIGLMQIKPDTAEWIAKKYHIPWKGEKSLFDPSTNVIYGTAYIAYLRDRFNEHGRLYLAAYNMGVTNVNRALGRDVWPKDYPAKVMQHYVKFYGDLRKAMENSPKGSQHFVMRDQDSHMTNSGFLFLTATGDLAEYSSN